MATITTGLLAETINGIKVNTSIKCASSNYTNCSSRNVLYVVMHYTGNSKDTAKANANYFSGGGRKASAHFFVDNSNIYQSVELRDRAWHCGGLAYYHGVCRNTNAFGIEMCCSSNYKVSAATKENAAHLCARLCKMLGIGASKVDTYVLRHYDVTHKSCPAQMAGSGNTEWITFKARVKEILSGTESNNNANNNHNSAEQENDMTKEETLKLIEETITEPRIYKNLEDMPDYYQAAVKTLVDKGAIAGTGDGLNLSDDLCRAFAILYKAGMITE